MINIRNTKELRPLDEPPAGESSAGLGFAIKSLARKMVESWMPGSPNSRHLNIFLS
jgi:hypothetical protein